MGTHAIIHVRDANSAQQSWATIGSDGHQAGDLLLQHSLQWKQKINDGDPPPEPGTPAEWLETLLVSPTLRFSGLKVEPLEVARPFSREWQYTVTLSAGQVVEIAAYERLCAPGSAGAGRLPDDGEPEIRPPKYEAKMVGSHRLLWRTELEYTGDWTDGALAGHG